MSSMFTIRREELDPVALFNDDASIRWPALTERSDFRFFEAASGPMMFENPLVASGYPCSLLDARYARCRGFLWEGTHAVPCDRDWDRALRASRHDFLLTCEIVWSEKLHEELMTATRAKGRPASMLRFTHTALRQWKQDFWRGALTIRAVAGAANVSEPTASRFVHGEMLWYI